MTHARIRLAIAAGLLTTGALGSLGWSAAQAQDDARQAIVVTPAQRAMMLAEMRGLLTSVNGILRGAATGDTALMRASAAAAGMDAMRQQHGAGAMGQGMGQGMGMGMGGSMPPAFMQLGHGTHAGFDSLAVAIANGVNQGAVVSRLANLTSNCVSCHAAYRLELR